MKQHTDFIKIFMSCTKSRTNLRDWLLLTTAILVVTPAAYAQAAQGVSEPIPEAVQLTESEQLRFDIPPQALSSALAAFGEAANLQLLYDAALTHGLSTKGVSGTYTAEQALRILLAGTELTARVTGSGVVTLERLAAGKGKVLPGVVVTAARHPTEIAAIPGSVTVLTREEIDKQAGASEDLGDIVGKLVPGMALSTETLSSFGQTLRGRNVAVLIDGVPQSSPLRNVLRDLRTIDSSAIERIEVIRGATAIYGNGATGGLINIITRKPAEGEVEFTTDLNAGISTTHSGDSARGNIAQGVSGRTGDVDYLLNASVGRTQGFFDAEGDRIPPDPQGQGGLADMTTVNLLGKFGINLGDRRIDMSVNHYDAEQDTDFTTVSGIAGQQKSTTEPGAPPGEGQGTENMVLSLNYDHGTVGDSHVTTQVYYQDYFARFGFASFFPDGGGQSLLLSKKHGVRLDVETPLALAQGTQLLWGLDYLVDRTSQPLEDGRIWVPEMDQTSVAPFAQLEANLGNRWLLRAGVRYEDIRVDVDDFTTLFGGNFVQGGELNYDATLLNAGAVYYPTDNLSLFANFSQGFSVAEVGRELRSTTASSVTNLQPEAQEVDNYELGLRYEDGQVQSSLAVFYNESELGVTFDGAPDFKIRRQPERIYGVEGTLDVALRADWRVGGSVTWMEGKRDTDNDGSFDRYLPGDRIPPLKLVAYVEHDLKDWQHRLQAVHSGNRDRFAGSTAFGEGKVENFTTFDWSSSGRVGPGTLRISVENLLNEQYFPVLAQAANLNSWYAAGQGRVLWLGYGLKY